MKYTYSLSKWSIKCNAGKSVSNGLAVEPKRSLHVIHSSKMRSDLGTGEESQRTERKKLKTDPHHISTTAAHVCSNHSVNE